MDNTQKDRLIDLGETLSSKFKNGVPSWLVSLLERFLHVPELNGYILKSPSDGWKFSGEVMKAMDIKVEVEGLENVPADGTLYTFASNHPLGGADGIILSSIIGENFGDLKVPVNDFLMAIKPLRGIWIPINKVGAQARNLATLMDDAFRSDKQMLIFPAGFCSRIIDGKIQDIEWTKTFITKSKQTGRPVVPVHFIGQNSQSFYRVAYWCKKLKLKFNLAMAFLPSELCKASGQTYKVVFGKPISPDTFDKSMSALEWAAFVRKKVYEL